MDLFYLIWKFNRKEWNKYEGMFISFYSLLRTFSKSEMNTQFFSEIELKYFIQILRYIYIYIYGECYKSVTIG